MRQVLKGFHLYDIKRCNSNTKYIKRYLSAWTGTYHNHIKCKYKSNAQHSYLHCHYNHRYYKCSASLVSNKHRLLSYYSYCIPKTIHIKKGSKGKITPNFGYAGEDSFFTFKLNVSKLKQNTNAATNNNNHFNSPLFFIGVADGVGSWKPQKAQDAAKYAQELMLSGIQYLSNASFDDICSDATHNEKCHNLSHKIAHFSSDTVVNKALKGASTLCLLNIEEYIGHDSSQFKCQLNAFNLGDSGFSVYRHKNDSLRVKGDDCYEIIYKSPAQEQGFGIPYQLGSHSTSNIVEDGYCLEHFNLKSLDIVIVGSDGLWDNLWDYEISTIICETMTKYYDNWKQNKENINGLSFNNYVHNKIVNGNLTYKIMKQAYQNSIDRKKSTPWSDAMTQTVDMVYDGGKPDDITCVVVFIH